MSEDILDERLQDILRTALTTADEELLVVGPSGEAVEELVDVAIEFDDDLPTIRLIADEAVLKDVMADFLVASNAADLIDAGTLSM
uniref:transcriptional regulator TbsP domain-containing protein n=1 Tax=Halegenticoccus soli TaxID=1985678 RepID=UPI001E62FA98